MPFKSNASRRDKFAKAKYRVKNRAEYNEALFVGVDTELGLVKSRAVSGFL